ncbi:MAG: energy transducer TonB [Acidobacteriota bacterium]
MFDQLVVSTVQRSKRRTAKFFFGTGVFYLVVVSSAFALSILMANPRLADTEVLTLVGRLPSPRSPIVHEIRQGSPSTTPPDLNNVQDFDAILSHRTTTQRRFPLPPGAFVPSGQAWLGAEGEGGPPSGIGSPGVFGGERMGDPPPTPDPPKPKPPAQPTVVDNKPIKVPSTVLQGKAIERRKPSYPPLAVQIRLQGDVAVEIIIAPDGRVETARVISGHPILATSAREAAMAWRFEPTLLNKVPVRVTGVITFVFKLSD